MEDKADVDMDTEAPQVSHKPGGEPKIKVSSNVHYSFINICCNLFTQKLTRPSFSHVECGP